MKTSNSVKEIDKFLQGKLGPASTLLFEAKLLIDPELRFKVSCQRKVLSIVKNYGRQAIKFDIERIHHELFSNSSKKKFQQEVYNIFTKN